MRLGWQPYVVGSNGIVYSKENWLASNTFPHWQSRKSASLEITTPCNIKETGLKGANGGP
ncbi:MAG: hypothetical protein WDN00_06850 [Limisphaerales bacterium]